MAKASKVEDYWRQHNIENVFKELTQILVRRMPTDPIVAIVEHLQKKYPKSFKTSINNSQIQSNISTHSDNQNESLVDLPSSSRRLSNQSQISGIVTIPTAGSAFTDLLKQDTSTTKLAPELNLKNLVFANRLSQQAVRLGKNIRSDRDIIEEEAIKPLKTIPPSTSNRSAHIVPEDVHNIETHEEPSVPQLVKYKQQIRNENDRRIHREKLAELAKTAREKEEVFQVNPDEIQQQDHLKTLSNDVSEETHKHLHKPLVRSKEEEEILNDENVFHSQGHRYKEKQRNKPLTSRSRYTTDLQSTIKNLDGTLRCKVCGNILTKDDSQPNSAAPTARSYQPQILKQSVETTTGVVDDWFESPSDISEPGELDDAITLPTGSTTFRRNLFQPINDNIVEHRPPTRPIIPSDDDHDDKKLKQSKTPRLSESGVFGRSPGPNIRRSSSTRSTPSPTPKKHQTETLATTNPPLTETRRMSDLSVREHSPDDSDDN